MAKFSDITGGKFNKLKVTSFSHRKPGSVYYQCICDCGTKKIIQGFKIISGKTKSCGCLKIEKNKKNLTKHGMCETKTYYIWASMIQRCENKKNKQYKYYGYRGIKVCRRWKTFNNFLNDMGEKPNNMSLDRIDNNKNYCKSNCRWATSKQQNNNKRNPNGNNFMKLTIDNVIRIKEMYSTGKYNFSSLGIIFKVSRSSISNIINKKTWK